MRYRDFAEGSLTPQTSTFWVNVATGRVIDVSTEMGVWSNHNEYVLTHPEVFGVADDPLIDQARTWTARKLVGDQAMRTLVCSRGWVRISCRIDFGRSMDVEAMTARDMRRAVLAMLATYPELDPLVGVHYDLHRPASYGRLKDADLIAFLETGRLRGRVAVNEVVSPIEKWRRWWGNVRTGQLYGVPAIMDHDHDQFIDEHLDTFFSEDQLERLDPENEGMYFGPHGSDPFLETLYAEGWQAILYDAGNQSLSLRMSGTASDRGYQMLANKIAKQVHIATLYIDRTEVDGAGVHSIKGFEISGRDLDRFLKTGRLRSSPKDRTL